MSRMPGWNRNSCGYHADDGKLYHESGMGRAFGPTCTTGDRMGCGVNFDSGREHGTVEVFFTKNGNQVGGVEVMKRPLNGLYPLIGKSLYMILKGMPLSLVVICKLTLVSGA